MAEVQKSQLSGEMTQRFIEFVMLHARQSAMFMGRIPNPQTGKPEIHLDAARLFIDQLEMIREKTRGNLSNEETEILTSVLADLQLGFVQASGGAPVEPEKAEVDAIKPEPSVPSAEEDEANKKKFTKSYGA